MNTKKKIKPNRLEVAKSQMTTFIDRIDVPTEIAENEGGMYHVLIVDGSFNQSTLESTFKARKQVYGRKSWEKVKNKLSQIGIQNAFILHDPTFKKEKKEAKNVTKDAGAGADAEAKQSRAEIIAEAKELGWKGALTAKNVVFLEFIENAKRTKEENENPEGGVSDEEVVKTTTDESEE